jgi:hypothetical protein
MSDTVDLEISCGGCGATLQVGSHHRTTQCPFCASPSVVERPHRASPDPTFVIGFVLDQKHALAAVQQWIRSRSIFARSDFKNAAAKLTQGVYLPAYLYGAVAESDYSADIGENYTVVETYTTTDSKGNTTTQTRTRIETEWRHLRGSHCCYMIDVIVTASKGVSNRALEAIEPFDLRALKRYSPAMISGWLAEDPSRSEDECFQLAHDESVEKLHATLSDFMPGDSHRNLDFETEFSDQSIDMLLLPVWLFAVKYKEDKPRLRILVNGQTGRIAGRVPLSATKITIAVLLGIAIVGALVLSFQ